MLWWLLGPFHLKLKKQRCTCERTMFHLPDSLVIGPSLLLLVLQECRVDGWVLLEDASGLKTLTSKNAS